MTGSDVVGSVVLGASDGDTVGAGVGAGVGDGVGPDVTGADVVGSVAIGTPDGDTVGPVVDGANVGARVQDTGQNSASDSSHGKNAQKLGSCGPSVGTLSSTPEPEPLPSSSSSSPDGAAVDGCSVGSAVTATVVAEVDDRVVEGTYAFTGHKSHLIGHKVTTCEPSLHRRTRQTDGSATVGSAVGSEEDGCSVGAGVGSWDGGCVGSGVGPGEGRRVG